MYVCMYVCTYIRTYVNSCIVSRSQTLVRLIVAVFMVLFLESTSHVRIQLVQVLLASASVGRAKSSGGKP